LLTATWIYQFKWVYYALFGLATGSFLNVLIYRLPLGMSLFHPPSSCPACRAPISWFDNIPILSFVLLGARCRSCRAPISWRYPAVEFLSMAAFLAVYFAFSFLSDLQRAYYIFFLLTLLAVALIDWDYQIIPDQLSYLGVFVGLLGSALFFYPRWERLVESVIGAAGFALLIWLIRILGGIAFRREAMGIGDIKLAAMMGAFLGWRLSLVAFIVAVFSGLAISSIVAFLQRKMAVRRLSILIFPGALARPEFSIATAVSQFLSALSGFSEVTVAVPGAPTAWLSESNQPVETFLQQQSLEAQPASPENSLILAVPEQPASAGPASLLLILAEPIFLSAEDRSALLQRLIETRRQIAVIALDQAGHSEDLKALTLDSGGLFFPVLSPSELASAFEQYLHHLSFTEIPFGTFLALGGAVSIFSGDYLWSLYLSHFWS
jgi:leader peptidase (prepilin peptidase)/N-methyltransferase